MSGRRQLPAVAPAPTRAWTRAALALLLLSCPSACRSPRASTTVVVFAAASLAEPFRAIEQAYEAAHPGTDVVLNFAGSQLLAAQLREGAAADVFASADPLTLERLLSERPAVPDSRRVFAINTLVVVVPQASALTTFDDLRTHELKLVLAGPEVPAGRYARQALDALGLRDAFEAKVVSNEDSVNGVLAKLELGEGDAGFVYATDLHRSQGRGQALRAIELPAGVDVEARYELAVLADGPTPSAGQAFATFVSGPEGQALLRAHGFVSPPAAAPD